eukprot:6182222-Pleurochrysis_carterae.AAC.1
MLVPNSGPARNNHEQPSRSPEPWGRKRISLLRLQGCPCCNTILYLLTMTVNKSVCMISKSTLIRYYSAVATGAADA